MKNMAINLCFFVLMLSGISNLFAQDPDTLWTKIYGGSDYNRGQAMVKTNDEGFVITGETGISQDAGLFTNGDIWLVKIDENGDTLWTKTYLKDGIDEGSSIDNTFDNGFIISGAVQSNNPAREFDAILIRTDQNGDTIWTKTVGTTSEDYAVSVKETSDSGFVFTGFTNTQTTFSRDVWLVRTNSNGDTIWTKTFGGSGEDFANAVVQTADDGFILAGSTREIGDESDLWLIRTDENGDTLWTKRYNGDPNFNSVDEGRDIYLLSDGGFAILAFSNIGMWLLRTDENGDTLWTKRFAGNANFLHVTSDGGFILAGGSSLVRTNENGEFLWSKNLAAQINSLSQASDGSFIAAGIIFQSNTLDDLWIARLNSEGTTAVENNTSELPAKFELSQNYPNPFNPTTKIKYSIPNVETGHAPSLQTILKIYDILGNEVATLVNDYRTPGIYEIEFNAYKLTSGVYFYRLQTGGFTATRKLVLMK